MPNDNAKTPTKGHVVLRGTERKAVTGAEAIGPSDPAKLIEVTVEVRRRQDLPKPASLGRLLTREELHDKYGADERDIQAVTEFAEQNGLRVVSTSVVKRAVVLAGTVGELSRIFGVTLQDVVVGERSHRQHVGPVCVPSELASIITDVRGLDNRPVARPHFRSIILSDAEAAQADSLSPVDVATRYNFPPGDGQGQTIAIIELGGGFVQADLNVYFTELGLTPPTVVAVPSGNGKNDPGVSAKDDSEVMLDIEVAGAVAPKAKILVYFAGDGDQGFIGAVQDAIHDAQNLPCAISISWGQSESTWTETTMNSFEQVFQEAASLGVPVFVSTGDDGSSDGEANGLHVDFPASAPHALGCGGTALVETNEVVWNARGVGATGGGVSGFFTKPDYQNNVQVPKPPTTKGGRGVPDVCGIAGPYKIRVNGSSQVVWGTSAVSPLWSGLTALLVQKLGRLPVLHPLLYRAAITKAGFADITQGNNDLSGNGGDYKAAVGWDACTGLGSPKGAGLLQVLQTTLTPKVVAGGNGSGSAADQLGQPRYICVDDDDNLYVSEVTNFRVSKWAPGATEGVILFSLAWADGVAVDAAGNLYVCDGGNAWVQKWAPGATSGVTVAGGNGNGSGANQLNNPAGIAVDQMGNVYISDFANCRIQRWRPGATQGETVAGGNGPGSGPDQLQYPVDVFLDSSSIFIYVSDCGNFRVQTFNVALEPGTTRGTVAGGNGQGSAANQLSNPFQIAADKSGNLYVADMLNHRVQRWAPGANAGVTVAGLGGRGPGINQLQAPMGVCLDSDGNLFVADTGNERVLFFDKALLR